MGHEWPESPLIIEATTVADDDFTWLNKKKVKASTLRSYVAGATTQTVTTSPATVAAKFVTLANDSFSAGTPGVLKMPPITEGAWHVIATPYEDVHYLVTKDAGDPVNTGPDLIVDSSYVRQQTIVLVAVERDGILRWHYDSTGYYVTQILSLVLSQASQLLALERPYADARTHEENGAAYTWSDGSAVKRLVINRTGSQCAVTLDESDWEDGETGRLDCYNTDNLGVQIIVGGGAVLNGRTAGLGYATLPGSTNAFDGMPPSYEVTRIDGGWTIRSMVDVADGVNDVLLGIVSAVSALEAPVNADTTADLSPGYSWTTAKLVHVTDNGRSEGCSLVLDSAVTTTGDWPIHETREVAKYNTSVYGFGFLMGASDTLNGGSAGVGSGIIPGTTTVPSATVARPAVTVRRDSATGWSWK